MLTHPEIARQFMRAHQYDLLNVRRSGVQVRRGQSRADGIRGRWHAVRADRAGSSAWEHLARGSQ